VVVGAPGSGKSSLIAALLGEMTCLAGMITWKPLVVLLLHYITLRYKLFIGAYVDKTSRSTMVIVLQNNIQV